VVARSIGGDVIASASSDKRGLFSLQVPASRRVVLSLEQPDGDAMIVIVGNASTHADGCLRDFTV
jgi:hypothetical protein